MITRTVFVQAEDQNGQNYENAIISVVLDKTDIDADFGYIIPEQKIFRSDANGQATLNLWPNARGSKDSRYRITATSLSGKMLFDVIANVPDVDGSDLEDISESVLCSDEVENSNQGGSVAEHVAEANPHPQYAMKTALDAHVADTNNPHQVPAADPVGSAAAALAAANSYTDSAIADIEPSEAVADHEAKPNPHPQYADKTAFDSFVARRDNPNVVTAAQVGADTVGSAAAALTAAQGYADGVGSAAISAASNNTANAINAHKVESDPHPIYAKDSDLSDHVSASDPHNVYVKKSDKGAANGVARLDNDAKVPLAQLPYNVANAIAAPEVTVARRIPVFGDTAGDTLLQSAASIDSDGNLFGHGDKVIEFSGTSLILNDTHKGKTIWCTNALSNVTIFAPDSDTYDLPAGYKTKIVRATNKLVSIITVGADVLYSVSVPVVINKKWGSALLVKKSAGVWWAELLNYDPTTASLNILTEATTLSTGGTYYIDYTAGAFDITMPEIVSIFTNFSFLVINGDVESMLVKPKILRNGLKIKGLDDDIEIDENYVEFTMKYFSSSYGYSVKGI